MRECRRRTSTSFLLRASLALSSMGVNPASFAHRCALVVFPIPGGPVIMTARNTFIPSLPGFLKSDLRLASKAFNQLCSFSIWPLFPQISLSVCGAYRSVHNWPPVSGFALGVQRNVGEWQRNYDTVNSPSSRGAGFGGLLLPLLHLLRVLPDGLLLLLELLSGLLVQLATVYLARPNEIQETIFV